MLRTPIEADGGKATEVAYVGEWTPLGRTVTVEAEGVPRPLPIGEEARDGDYAWGRSGAGPREVARAILLDATGNPMLAERLCRPLTWEVIANLPAEGFRITRGEIQDWVQDQA